MGRRSPSPKRRENAAQPKLPALPACLPGQPNLHTKAGRRRRLEGGGREVCLARWNGTGSVCRAERFRSARGARELPVGERSGLLMALYNFSGQAGHRALSVGPGSARTGSKSSLVAGMVAINQAVMWEASPSPPPENEIFWWILNDLQDDIFPK